MTFRIRLDSLPGEHDGFTLYDCVNRAEHDRTVWFVGQPPIDGTATITVRAKLGVIRHKPSVINGTAFEGFTEFRLMQAVPVP